MKPTCAISKEPFVFYPLRREGVGSSSRLVDEKKTSVSLEWKSKYEIVFNMLDAWEIYIVDLSSFDRGSFSKKSVGIVHDDDLVRFLNWVVAGDVSHLLRVSDCSLHGKFLCRLSSIILSFSNTYGVGYVQERILL